METDENEAKNNGSVGLIVDKSTLPWTAEKHRAVAAVFWLVRQISHLPWAKFGFGGLRLRPVTYGKCCVLWSVAWCLLTTNCAKHHIQSVLNLFF